MLLAAALAGSVIAGLVLGLRGSKENSPVNLLGRFRSAAWSPTARAEPSEDRISAPELSFSGRATNGMNTRGVWKSVVQPSPRNLKHAANRVWNKVRLTALDFRREIITAWKPLVSRLLDVGKNEMGAAKPSDQYFVSTALLVALGPEILPASVVPSPGWDTRCAANLDEARSYLKRDTPAVVLSSLQLVDGSGTSLIGVVTKHRGWLFLRTTVLGQTVWLPAVLKGVDAWGMREQLTTAHLTRILQRLSQEHQRSSILENYYSNVHNRLLRLPQHFRSQ